MCGLGTDDDEFVEVVIISAFNFNFISVLFQLFVSLITITMQPKKNI